MGSIRIQISSGQGPAECELAAGKLVRLLLKEYPDFSVLSSEPGVRPDCFASAVLCADGGADTTVNMTKGIFPCIDGTVQWICVSPYRPHHKRKNWFVDIHVIDEVQTDEYDESHIRFETFRSGGKGGQNVNKVETGVRAVYIPTGTAAVCTSTRSQYLNRQYALSRLCAALAEQQCADREAGKKLTRALHFSIERGNPVRVYEGMEFRRIR